MALRFGAEQKWNAFYRTEGEEAIHAAPETTRKLDALRRDLIDHAANDYRRGARRADGADSRRQGPSRGRAEPRLAAPGRTGPHRVLDQGSRPPSRRRRADPYPGRRRDNHRAGPWPPAEVPSRQGEISVSTIAVPELGAPTLGEAAAAAAKELSRAIARVVPYAGCVASAGGLAASALLVVPGNTQATTTGLGGGLRIRKAPGQRTVTIERQVDKGLLGTGIGAKWEELPVDAEHATAPDGGLKYDSPTTRSSAIWICQWTSI